MPLQLCVHSSVQSRIQRKKERDLLGKTPSTLDSSCHFIGEDIEIELNEESSKVVEEVISGLSQNASHSKTCKCDKSV